MKKYRSIAVVCLLLLALVVLAQAETLVGTVRPWAVNTLLNAATSTGDGTAVDLGTFATQFTCWATTGGTAPTSVALVVYGSADGTTYGALQTWTYTVASSDTAFYHIAYKPVRYLKGNYASKVGGSTDTEVTLKCAAGGN